MNEFWLWFNTGTEHILDWNGYDHILYVMALCVLFSVKEWKKLLILVTAFTIGHSLTLAVSALNIFTMKQGIIEVLIPLTILFTCIVNLYYKNRLSSTSRNQSNNYTFNYALALVFGFIHGMGFSYLLRSMLGKEESVVFPLLSFNLGLELGQLIIVAVMLLFSIFLTRFTRIKKGDYVFFISSAVFGIAFLLFVQRLKDL
ncbi:MAG: HupE/UreJ family protein [Bacteroidetes bacterium]|nr:HupE/UreJ family protein [Bacteroidota bacterium]